MNLDAQYNNRALVPDHADVIKGWVADAAGYRAYAGAELDVAYGEHARHRLDLFHAKPAQSGPIVLFIHGGYWQALDKSYFSHVARGLNEAGFSVCIPSYRLAPEATVADIIDDMRTCCAWLSARFVHDRIIASGHSAGGHLAACLLATDWSRLELPAHLVPGAVGISGLYDLRPLMATYVNDALGLDEQAARDASPLCWPAPAGKQFQAWVGSDESREYHRQSETLAACWTGAGLQCTWHLSPEDNHFTVIRHLSDPKSELTNAIVSMCGKT